MDDQSETIALIREIRRELHERFDQLDARLNGLSGAIEARTRELEMLTETYLKRPPASRAAALEVLLKGLEAR